MWHVAKALYTLRKGHNVMANAHPTGLQPKPKMPDNIWLDFTPAIQSIISKKYLAIKARSSSSDAFSDDEEVVLWTKAMLSVIDDKYFISSPEESPRPGWIRENITGLMLVTAILTVAFGILGAWGISNSTTATSGFLDIAKLFAGTLVGAAGAAGIGAATAKR
jgi:hypothetical protein